MSAVADLLETLVGIPSVTGQEQELAEFCEGYLQSAGFQTRQQEAVAGRWNVLAQKGAGPALLLYAHLDTVAPAPDWGQDPFQLRHDGDHWVGLGASDMKGGLAALLSAAAAAEPQGYTLKVALGVDEEAWSQGAYALIADPWCQDIRHGLVPELGVTSSQEHITLGRRGHFSFSVDIQGRRVHGALAQEGINAIELASQLVLQLKQFPLPTQPEWGPESLFIRQIQGGAQDLSVPGQCRLLGSWFTHPQRPAGVLLQQLQAFLATAGVPFVLTPAVRPTPAPAGYGLSREEPFGAWVQQQAARVLGYRPPLVYSPAVADENVLYAGLQVPVVSLAPVGGQSHQAGEWVSQASLERVSRVYRQILNHYPIFR